MSTWYRLHFPKTVNANSLEEYDGKRGAGKTTFQLKVYKTDVAARAIQ